MKVDGLTMGRSPAAPELDAMVSHVVELELEGYHRERIDLISIPQGFGRLSPEYIQVDLEPKGGGADTVSSSGQVRAPQSDLGTLDTPGGGSSSWPVETDSDESTQLKARMGELSKLLGEGTITEEEYRALRFQLLLNALQGADQRSGLPK